MLLISSVERAKLITIRLILFYSWKDGGAGINFYDSWGMASGFCTIFCLQKGIRGGGDDLNN
jgi:hypothetical protein